MQLGFVAPVLSALDAVPSEVLIGNLWQDQRPCDGVAALYDWRSGNQLSKIIGSGFVSGELGEVILIPGRKRLSFDKILLFGLGPRADFDAQRFEIVTRSMVNKLDLLCATQVVIELPGRTTGQIEPEAATDALLAIVGEASSSREWTLVEENDAKRRIEKHLLERRTRIRRID